MSPSAEPVRRGRAGLAAEIFLWVAVVILCLAGVVTVLGDDLLSAPGRNEGTPSSRLDAR